MADCGVKPPEKPAVVAHGSTRTKPAMTAVVPAAAATAN
jgi:hypothetical protein